MFKMEEALQEMNKGTLAPLGLCLLPMTKSGPGEAAPRERADRDHISCLIPNRRFEGGGLL